MAAAGKIIKNLGRIVPQMIVETGDLGSVDFSAADVQKLLLAVSAVSKKGNPCWFDGESSFIIPGTAEELSQIRALIAAISAKIPLHLENGTFKMRSWSPPSRPFQGPGW